MSRRSRLLTVLAKPDRRPADRGGQDGTQWHAQRQHWPAGPSRWRRTRFGAAEGSGSTLGSGAIPTGPRFCSSTAGRRATSAGRSRSTEISPPGIGSSPSTCAATVCRRSRSGPEHYADGQLWADDLAAVIEQTGLERPVVVAWSYGGYIVADFLRAYGDAIDRRDQPGRRGRDPEAAEVRSPRPGTARERPGRLRARPRHEHRRDPALPARVHRTAARRGRLDRGAVLEHGRARRRCEAR